MKKASTIQELETVICEPSCYTSQHKKSAILRLWGDFHFIEYPRKELKQVFKELNNKIQMLESGIEMPTATDRFLLTILKRMGGNS